MFNVQAGPNYSVPVAIPRDFKETLRMQDKRPRCLLQTWWVRWRGMVIPFFKDTDCSSPTLASSTFVVCFGVNFSLWSYSRPLLWLLFGYLFQRLKMWDDSEEQREHEHPSSLVLSSSISSSLFSFSSSLRPLGRAAESLSPPSLHPQSALAPPSSTLLLFPLTKPSSQELDNLCHLPSFTVNSPWSLSWAYVCVSLFFFFAEI